MDGIPALLAGTLNTATAKSAEEALKSCEYQDRTFPIQLLELVNNDSCEVSIKLAASLYFKNYVRRHWDAEDDASIRISDNDKELIKSELVNLMMKSPTLIQVQLGEVISYIANYDFYEKWDSLLPDLISRLSPTDMTVNIPVLSTAHAIFKRWRPQFRSDELFLEIKYVLDRFCEPFLALFTQTTALLQSAPVQQDPTALELVLRVVLLECKIFYDLNCQDIPEFFEDHMDDFMNAFLYYFTYTNPLLETNDDAIETVIKVKASICEIVELYTLRYEEVFTKLTDFVNVTWTMLTSMSQDEKFDLLVGKAMAFLTSVIRVRRHAEFFLQDGVLQQFVELVVLPNICLRESDEEMFEDDPLEYVRRDLEGSSSDSRSRSAVDLVRGLLDHFDQQITAVISNHITQNLQEAGTNPALNWGKKYAALQLFSAIAIKGQSAKLGVTSVNLMVDVVSFFENFIKPDLAQPLGNVHPMVVTEEIKFVFTFRNQLSSEQLLQILPVIMGYLQSPSFVVHTYSAIAIDQLLTVKHKHVHIFTHLHIAPHLQGAYNQLFMLIESADTPQKLAENDHLMKAIMRLTIIASEAVLPTASFLLEHICKVTTEVSKNPSNPKFNHYLFETIGALIRNLSATGPSTLNQLETALFPVFQFILAEDVVEFIPYVLQLLSQLIEANANAPLPDFVVSLIQPCLAPALWDSKGNIPALVRLLQATISRGPQLFVTNNYVEPVLGIYQRLISSRVNDVHGFNLLEKVLTVFDANTLSPYINHIFFLILARLRNSKTERFVLRLTVFIFYLASMSTGYAGPENIIKGIDGVQAGVFGQIMTAFILPETQKIAVALDRKIVAVGATHFLKCEAFIAPGAPYERLIIPLLGAILKLFELPVEQAKGDEDLTDAIDADDLSFQASFSRLVTTGGKRIDPFPQVTDPKQHLALEMNTINKHTGNRLSQIVSTQLPGDGQSVLQSYGFVL
ncbi:karyopherin Kap109 [Schizosaccharomyces japonicus yFS275]|uniref:Karyopherin Kap109 n=1 Tax=Schizosaccharomyces japonicus (strain yFS275 / FY16936) TaxID=402676 RepID=B6K6M9_SCHJY|nr:karyopherin Kap109 [Schizosaccharomyces japonicus yFS275]EEB09183.1 karyopherin Kap109 [Schizosaccharomyces japonicus yFS275]